MEDVNNACVAFLVSETTWTCDRTRRQPATAINGHQYDYDFGFLWIARSTIFTSTAHSKYRWRKNIRIREKSVYTAKLSGFKSFRIQSSHFRFRIQNLRRHDQTGMFSFRIRPLVCKRQNQSGTKTFRIHHESGTISSSVNLVLETLTAKIELRVQTFCVDTVRWRVQTRIPIVIFNHFMTVN